MDRHHYNYWRISFDSTNIDHSRLVMGHLPDDPSDVQPELLCGDYGEDEERPHLEEFDHGCFESCTCGKDLQWTVTKSFCLHRMFFPAGFVRRISEVGGREPHERENSQMGSVARLASG